MLGTYTNYFTSAVNVTVSLGWRYGSQFFVRPCSFPFRVVLSVSSIIFREGFKVSVSSWINTQKKKKMRQLRSGIQLKISKTFRWASSKNSAKKIRLVDPVCVGGEHDIIAVDAAMKYETLAIMRLDRARVTFEAAAKELKEAEREVADAKKYTKSVKSYCKKCQENQSNASDYVFVDPAPKNLTETRKNVAVVKEESEQSHTSTEDES
ncbi:hypothetical protein QTG54_007096 [Skeletonema marinoi]|uniref:Uncharacterized protein n=1 Tax=Skeletonema marinoi TaxID=267567 RepID=A0AAD8YC10_9STRA|nr:hypothetical protein QTG54_007096 [Skeletonema marinoi]